MPGFGQIWSMSGLRNKELVRDLRLISKFKEFRGAQSEDYRNPKLKAVVTYTTAQVFCPNVS